MGLLGSVFLCLNLVLSSFISTAAQTQTQLEGYLEQISIEEEQNSFILHTEDKETHHLSVSGLDAVKQAELSNLAGSKIGITTAQTSESIPAESDQSLEIVDFHLIEERQDNRANISGTSGSQTLKYITIGCKFHGDSHEPSSMTTQNYQYKMSADFPGVNNFYKTISYGRTDLQLNDMAKWFELPKTKDQYSNENSSKGISMAYDIMDDCMALADKSVDFSQYDGIITIPNRNYTYDFGAVATVGTGYTSGYDGKHAFKKVWLQPDWLYHYMISHELGHNLGWYHSGSPAQSYDSKWDVMSGGRWSNGSVRPPVGAILPNLYYSGHIPDNKITTYSLGQSQNIVLNPLSKSQDQWAENQMGAIIPISEDKYGNLTVYYSVEARWKDEQYDQGIPESGIIIHKYDRSLPGGKKSVVINQENPNDANGPGAVLTPGESYTIPENQVKIVVESQDDITQTFQVSLSDPSVIVEPEPEPQPEKSSIGSPQEGQTFSSSESVYFKVNSATPQNTEKVEFIVNEEVFSEDKYPPYQTTLKNLPGGTYLLNAKIIDKQGNQKQTDTVSINVEQSSKSQPPTFTPWVSDYSGFTNKAFQLRGGQDKLIQTHVGTNNRIYTRVTDQKNVYHSPDSGWSLWRTGSDPYEYTNHPVNLAEFNGKLYQVHVGSNHRIYTRISEDGVNWGAWRTGSDPYEYTNFEVSMEEVKGKIYEVHTGGDRQIYTRISEDGVNWGVWTKNDGETDLPVTMTNFNDELYQGHVGSDRKMYWRKLFLD